MKRIRPFKELATSFYLNNPTEVQRFTGASYAEAKIIFKLAFDHDKEDLGIFQTTRSVRRKTVMKIIGMSNQDLTTKMRMLEHPQENDLPKSFSL